MEVHSVKSTEPSACSGADATTLALSIFPGSAWRDIAHLWSELVEKSSCSVFLTREWVESWLEVFGADVDPSFLVLHSDGELRGACLVVRNRPRPLAMRRIWLNASGEPGKDTTYVEYNGILASIGWETKVTRAVANWLDAQQWDELVLAGFSAGPTYDLMKSQIQNVECSELCHRAHYVDLAAIRRAGGSYPAAVSGRSGKHLRENLRYYAELGPLRVEIADSPACASEMLDELAVLSKKRWDSLGQRSIFWSDRFTAFHRTFLGKRFSLGGVQLARVTAGNDVVGIVYNLVRKGNVYFYQCGFSYGVQCRLSPGRAALSLVIQYCLEAGYNDFDFLSGELPYKERMATNARTMNWATLRRTARPRLASAVRRMLKSANA